MAEASGGAEQGIAAGVNVAGVSCLGLQNSWRAISHSASPQDPAGLEPGHAPNFRSPCTARIVRPTMAVKFNNMAKYLIGVNHDNHVWYYSWPGLWVRPVDYPRIQFVIIFTDLGFVDGKVDDELSIGYDPGPPPRPLIIGASVLALADLLSGAQLSFIITLVNNNSSSPLLQAEVVAVVVVVVTVLDQHVLLMCFILGIDNDTYGMKLSKHLWRLSSTCTRKCTYIVSWHYGGRAERFGEARHPGPSKDDSWVGSGWTDGPTPSSPRSEPFFFNKVEWADIPSYRNGVLFRSDAAAVYQARLRPPDLVYRRQIHFNGDSEPVGSSGQCDVLSPFDVTIDLDDFGDEVNFDLSQAGKKKKKENKKEKEKNAGYSQTLLTQCATCPSSASSPPRSSAALQRAAPQAIRCPGFDGPAHFRDPTAPQGNNDNHPRGAAPRDPQGGLAVPGPTQRGSAALPAPQAGWPVCGALLGAAGDAECPPMPPPQSGPPQLCQDGASALQPYYICGRATSPAIGRASTPTIDNQDPAGLEPGHAPNFRSPCAAQGSPDWKPCADEPVHLLLKEIMANGSQRVKEYRDWVPDWQWLRGERDRRAAGRRQELMAVYHCDGNHTEIDSQQLLSSCVSSAFLSCSDCSAHHVNMQHNVCIFLKPRCKAEAHGVDTADPSAAPGSGPPVPPQVSFSSSPSSLRQADTRKSVTTSSAAVSTAWGAHTAPQQGPTPGGVADWCADGDAEGALHHREDHGQCGHDQGHDDQGLHDQGDDDQGDDAQGDDAQEAPLSGPRSRRSKRRRRGRGGRPRRDASAGAAPQAHDPGPREDVLYAGYGSNRGWYCKRCLRKHLIAKYKYSSAEWAEYLEKAEKKKWANNCCDNCSRKGQTDEMPP
eukprot:TRINITY_DN384_c0_g1_i2.p1 TRINITY_DN384_c0_g1~~TRINITY_DN384_c0_g1_i2.p1  ORF type:complete len:880 (+),score=57.68 TRINITY_DN384_c0_g1_i2:112-2751(+)